MDNCKVRLPRLLRQAAQALKSPELKRWEAAQRNQARAYQVYGEWKAGKRIDSEVREALAAFLGSPSRDLHWPDELERAKTVNLRPMQQYPLEEVVRWALTLPFRPEAMAFPFPKGPGDDAGGVRVRGWDQDNHYAEGWGLAPPQDAFFVRKTRTSRGDPWYYQGKLSDFCLLWEIKNPPR
jgi:hypothetical protein